MAQNSAVARPLMPAAIVPVPLRNVAIVTVRLSTPITEYSTHSPPP